MKTTKAIISLLNTEGYDKVTVKEMKEFKSSCTDKEYEALGKQACKIIGEKYEK